MKPSANKQTTVKPMASAAGRSGTSTIELPDGMWERIACKAYELWRERRCREGYALQTGWMRRS